MNDTTQIIIRIALLFVFVFMAMKPEEFTKTFNSKMLQPKSSSVKLVKYCGILGAVCDIALMVMELTGIV